MQWSLYNGSSNTMQDYGPAKLLLKRNRPDLNKQAIDVPRIRHKSFPGIKPSRRDEKSKGEIIYGRGKKCEKFAKEEFVLGQAASPFQIIYCAPTCAFLRCQMNDPKGCIRFVLILERRSFD